MYSGKLSHINKKKNNIKSYITFLSLNYYIFLT